MFSPMASARSTGGLPCHRYLLVSRNIRYQQLFALLPTYTEVNAPSLEDMAVEQPRREVLRTYASTPRRRDFCLSRGKLSRIGSLLAYVAYALFEGLHSI